MDFTLELAVLLRVAGAMAVGTLIGLERELAGKPAGLRTHMLVTGASCLIVLLGDLAISEFYAAEASGVIQADPLRIFEAIIVGVSFLGAGTIWKSQDEHRVEGLTTAASLLFAATLGAAVALERFGLAVVLAVFTLALSRLLRLAEARMAQR
ncbi:MAG: MgtC/SapB family protein [Trueperaceae bacterium]|nr:MgtC/SapB family protein [Trueperaceae bacterium]